MKVDFLLLFMHKNIIYIEGFTRDSCPGVPNKYRKKMHLELHFIKYVCMCANVLT